MPALRRHFVSVWFHRKPSSVAGHSAVVPDACADLVWCRGNLVVAGPDRQVHLETVEPGTTVVGMRFVPGVTATLLKVPASEILGARLPLDCFWRSKARELTDVICDAAEPLAIAERLETALAKMAGNFDSPDRRSRLIFTSIAKPRRPGRAVVPELMSALDCSERTLRRHCESAFGYGPKTLDRVLRIQRLLELARARPELGLANLAGMAGYADQAHLSREARRLTGLTPIAILGQFSQSRAVANGTPAAP